LGNIITSVVKTVLLPATNNFPFRGHEVGTGIFIWHAKLQDWSK